MIFLLYPPAIAGANSPLEKANEDELWWFVAQEEHRYRQRWDRNAQKLYYVHRAIAEWRLGRPLQVGEVVHHLDGDKSNNHPDNLEVLPSQRVHMIVHHYERREARGVQHLFPLSELLRL